MNHAERCLALHAWSKVHVMIATLQAAANGAGIEQNHTKQFLDHVDERLVGDFDALAEKQRNLSADMFNNDDNYKLYLNEVSKVANSVMV